MKLAFLIMLLVAIFLLILGYYQDPSLPLKGIRNGLDYFLRIFPILIVAFIIAGMIQVLIPSEFIIEWLGKESGLKGVFLGSVAGALTPGGPFVSFPIAASLYKSGAGIGTIVAFVTAWCLWSLTRLPYEIAFIGLKFTLIRIASTFLFPPLAGIIAQSFFSK